jgi:hypothetical protein
MGIGLIFIFVGVASPPDFNNCLRSPICPRISLALSSRKKLQERELNAPFGTQITVNSCFLSSLTVALAPGGLMWWHIIELFEALAAKGQILGLNLVELAPKNDLNQISMIGAGRLVLKLIMLQLMKSQGKMG